MPDQITYPTRKNIRLNEFNYSLEGYYFITIVIQNRINLFGQIQNSEMVLNDAGKTIDLSINAISDIYSGVIITHYIVMPNHIHFIIYLPGNIHLAEIIRRFKSYTTHLYIQGVKEHNWPRFDGKLWQHNYYEHIIRNERSYDFIRHYIITNPLRWNKDAINPNHDEDSDEIMKQVLELS